MKRRLQKAGIILSILLVILATGYFAGTWYLKQKNEGTKQTTAQADGQKAYKKSKLENTIIQRRSALHKKLT